MRKLLVLIIASLLIFPIAAAQESVILCSDPDGFDPYVKGETFGYNLVAKDKSIDLGVIEYGCIENEVKSVFFECPNNDGACLYEESDNACEETNSGIIEGNKFYPNTCAKFSSDSFDDYLIKYSCENGKRKEEVIRCLDNDNVCIDGRCVPLTENMISDDILENTLEVICKETPDGIHFGENFFSHPGCTDYRPTEGGFKKISKYVCPFAELEEENCVGDTICVDNKCVNPEEGRRNFISGENNPLLLIVVFVFVAVLIIVLLLQKLGYVKTGRK